MSRMRVLTVAFSIAFLLVLTTTAFAFGGAPLVATLSGANEVPAGDPDATGSATITLNPGHSTVCWDITISNVTLPATGAHIHVAPAGVAGPIVVPFTPPNASGVSSGCKTVDRDLIQNILTSPESYYVNVHTTQFPAGAARGQLSHPGQGR